MDLTESTMMMIPLIKTCTRLIGDEKLSHRYTDTHGSPEHYGGWGKTCNLLGKNTARAQPRVTVTTGNRKIIK